MKLVGSIHKSSERPTTVDCFRELGRVIQRDHGPTCVAAVQKLQSAQEDAADASNVMQAMMLLQQARFRAKAAQDRVKAA